MQTGDKNLIFLVMHEGGAIIYTYPPLEEEQYILSPLVSAVFAILEYISKTENEVMSVSTKDKELFALKKGEVIYALFLSKDLKTYGSDLLLSLIDIVDRDFPAEIVEGIVKVREDTSDLTLIIEKFLKSHLEAVLLAEKKKPLPMSDALRIFGTKKAAKFYRSLIAGKRIVIYGYNSDLIYRVVRTLLLCWPEPLPICTNTGKVPADRQVIVVVGREQVEVLRGCLKDAEYMDFDKPLREKIKKDYLLECIEQTLSLESDEARIMKLRGDILTLNAIVEDIMEAVEESNEVSIDKLRRELQKKHPPEKVAYILEVLAREKSWIMERIRTPNKTLEEIFF